MEFIKSVGATVGGIIKVDNPLIVGLATLGLALLIVISIIICICVSVSKKKKAKALAIKKAEEERATKENEQKELERNREEEKAKLEQENKAKEEINEQPKEETPIIKKETAKKSSEKKVEPKKEEKPAKKMLGKWVVEQKSENEYVSCLLASNGEIMLRSEVYASEDGARLGVQTIIKGVETGKFVIYQDKKKNSYYKLKSAGNRLLCAGEIYKSEEQCLKAVESVKRIAKDSPVAKGVIQGSHYAEYTPAKLDEEMAKKGLKGKWKIETTANGNYSAKLYASNGQLMLATEEVAMKKNAQKCVESVIKNATAGNFIIDRDKFGRFYYKLRTAQKSVICIGEAYESLDSCVKAIESVRRFAINAVIVEE